MARALCATLEAEREAAAAVAGASPIAASMAAPGAHAVGPAVAAAVASTEEPPSSKRLNTKANDEAKKEVPEVKASTFEIDASVRKSFLSNLKVHMPKLQSSRPQHPAGCPCAVDFHTPLLRSSGGINILSWM